MAAYCEVALPVPLDRTFTYAVREGQLPVRGARVIVPFRNEKLIGVVTGVSDAAPTDFEARFLEAVLDEEPLLSENLLALAEWMAGYYLAPLGEVLRGMLPLAAEVRRTVYYRIRDGMCLRGAWTGIFSRDGLVRQGLKLAICPPVLMPGLKPAVIWTTLCGG